MIPTYLAEKNAHMRDSHIKFDEGPHVYHIDGDSNYTSVTKWNHSHFEKFNANAIIEKMMKGKNWKNSQYYGKTAKQIKDQWSENGKIASEAGTKMHYDIECFYNNMKIENKSIEYEYFLRFHKQNTNLEPYRTEWMIFNKELKLAGSIDMIFKNEDGSLSIYDWKRCKNIKKDNKWQSAKTECIEHLPDTNFWHYSLQLNTYKAMLESKYDVKVKDLYLVCLHPDNKSNTYEKIKVPILKKEMKSLFELRKSQLN